MKLTSNAQRSIRSFTVVTTNLFIFVLLLVLVELAASIFVAKPKDNIIDDAYLNHTWKPNSYWVHDEWIKNNPEFPEPYTHHYNSQSWLENYDIKKSKAINSYRIFYVGDSFTEGTCPMNKSVPSLVKQGLTDLTRGSKQTVEVINTGTSSYSPTLYYLLIRHKILSYNPDLIIVNVDMTDCFDDWKYSETLTVDQNGDPVAAPPRDLYRSKYLDTAVGAVKLTPWHRLKLFLFQYSHAYVLVQKIVSRLHHGNVAQEQAILNDNGTSIMRRRWGWMEQEWSVDTKADVDRTLDMLLRVIDLCRQNGVKIMLTSVPHYNQYAKRTDEPRKTVWSNRPHYAIEDLARRQNVPYLNSYEALRPYIQGTSQTKYYYHGDMHFNTRGYELWAKSQTNFLLQKKNALLPDSYYLQWQKPNFSKDQKRSSMTLLP